MKDNREFLEGIYAKAKVLEEEKFNRRKKQNKILQLTSVAALLVIIPLFAFKDQILNPRPARINGIEPNGIRMFTMDYEEYFSQADHIVIGNLLDYDVLNEKEIRIEVEKSFLGQIDSLIKLDYLEGFGGERVLLFLKEDGDFYSLLNKDSYFMEVREDVFQDNLGNTISIQDIEDNIRRKD